MLNSVYAVVALSLMVATVMAKVGATRLIELAATRSRMLERKRQELRQQFSTLCGEGEILRREHRRAAQDVDALKAQVHEARALLEELEGAYERRNRRLARCIQMDQIPDSGGAALVVS